jgi:hypothetical protein
MTTTPQAASPLASGARRQPGAGSRIGGPVWRVKRQRHPGESRSAWCHDVPGHRIAPGFSPPERMLDLRRGQVPACVCEITKPRPTCSVSVKSPLTSDRGDRCPRRISRAVRPSSCDRLSRNGSAWTGQVRCPADPVPAEREPSRRTTQRHPAAEPVILTWIPGRCPSSSTVCPPTTHVDRGREVPDGREFPARHLQSGWTHGARSDKASKGYSVNRTSRKILVRQAAMTTASSGLFSSGPLK